jgi:polysaccharide export outer membrane protein
MERELSTYLKNPVVTVMVTTFRGLPSEQIRVVGEAAKPQAIPYRGTMTLLDVMIAVGGLTEYAAGDRAVLIREVDGKRRQYNVRLDDLLRDGDISANVKMLPGDILIIPEAWF